MKVLFVSRLPVAGAPYETMKCLRKYSDIEVNWMCMRNKYPDGRVFPSDIIYDQCNQKHRDLLDNCDIIHIQNDHMLDEQLLRRKNVIVEFHCVPRRLTYEIYKKYNATYFTVDQPWLEKEYPELRSLPNLMDVEEYVPEIREQRQVHKIAFAPTNSWTTDKIGSRAKKEIVDMLQRLSKDGLISFDLIEGSKYESNLRRKREADILIDDVVNNTWHKTSLEGCCFGLSVVTSWQSDAFVYSDLKSLENTLKELCQDRQKLANSKEKSREWVVSKRHPKDLVQIYQDAYKQVLKGK